MKAEVRYCSRKGTVKRVAEAVAGGIGVVAKDVASPLAEPVDVLFLAGAMYAGNIDKKLRAFAETLTPDKVGRVAVISVAASEVSIEHILRDILGPRGVTLCEKSYKCKGRFLFTNVDSPTKAELDGAAAYARGIVGAAK